MAEIEPWMREAAEKVINFHCYNGSRPIDETAEVIAESYARRPTPAGCEEAWSTEPPSGSGVYWHWTGRLADCAEPTYVGYLPEFDTTFVCPNQLGLKKAINCKEYGGWWKLAKRPTLDELAALAASQTTAEGR